MTTMIWQTRHRMRIGGAVLLMLLASIAGAVSPIQTVQAAEAWRTAPALPDVREASAATTGIDGTIYAIGGLDGSFDAQSTVYSYKPGVDTAWQPVPSLPSARDSLAAAVGADGDIYAIGGEDSLSEPQSTVYRFKPGVDTEWQTAPSLPVSLKDLAAATGADGTIYAIGGFNRTNSVQSKVYTFKPGTDTQWNQAPALPSALQRLAATSVGGTIYVIGGYGLNNQSTVYSYTPGTDTAWQIAPALPVALGNLAATVVSGTIYAIGGLNGTIQNTVYTFTPGADTKWNAAPSLPVPLEFLAATTDASGTIYAIGGLSTNLAPLSTVYSFTPTLESTEQPDQSQTNTNIAGTSAIYVLNSIAQTFTAGITGGLDRVSLNLTRIGSVTDDLIVGIYPTSGGKPVTSGAPLARAVIHAADVPVSEGGFGATMIDASFSTPIPIVAGTTYAIVATSSVPSAEDVEGAQLNYYGWSVHAPILGQTDNYSGGDTFQNTDFGGGFSGWIDANEDQTFATYVLPELAPQTRHVTNCADSGAGTLRGRLNAARAGDTIVYDQDCTTTLTSTVTLTKNVTIDASGHTVILDGNNAATVLVVPSEVTASISSLTIQHGNGAGSSNDGGGVSNQGTLTLNAVTLTANITSGFGGGIRNDGILTILNSTFSGNSADEDAGGLYDSGHTTIVNSTFTGNEANISGGAILSDQEPITITNSTFANNVAQFGGGVNIALNSALTITNSIIAGSTGGDLARDHEANTINGENNVIDDDTFALLSGNGNLNQPPLIGTLSNYGGPTQTIPLLPGSPAIDAGSCATGYTDQRGLAQVGSACDIGAFESQGFTLTPATDSSPQSTPINTAFANPLAVTVTANEPVEPVDGGTVSFTVNPVTGIGATLSAATATISGGATSVTATANGLEGSYTVTAAIPGLTPVTFNLTNTELPDVVAPTTTASAVLAGTSTAYTFGTWTNQGVTVTLSASDATAATDDTESGIAHTYYTLDNGSQQTYGTPFTISTEDDHTITFWSVDNAGNSEDSQTIHILIDLTNPTITYSDNLGTYTVDQTVDIHCQATDALSGVASDCQDINGSAASFGLGTHTSTGTAMDHAGNTSSNTVTFTVEVSTSSLTDLTAQYAGNSRVAKQLSAPLRMVQLAERMNNPRLKNAAINSYIVLLNTQRGRGLTAQEVATLTQLARAL